MTYFNTFAEGYFKREVTPSGNSAKVGCPKRYLGREAILVIV